MSQNTGVIQGVKLPNGKVASQTGDAQGNIGTAFGHVEKYLATYGGRTFFASTQTPVTTSAAAAATYTGLCLSNPVGSTVNLALQVVSAQFVVAPAALTAMAVMVGLPGSGGITAHTTPLAVNLFGNSKLGQPAGQGLVDLACTLVGTPVIHRWLAETPAATSVAQFLTDFRGGLIVPPGGWVALYTSIASPANGVVASFEWEEAPL